MKGEQSPPPITVRTHFRLGLHVKSHSPTMCFGGLEKNSLFWHGAVRLCHWRGERGRKKTNPCSYKCGAPLETTLLVKKKNATRLTLDCSSNTFGLISAARKAEGFAEDRVCWRVYVAGELIKTEGIHQTFAPDFCARIANAFLTICKTCLIEIHFAQPIIISFYVPWMVCWQFQRHRSLLKNVG